MDNRNLPKSCTCASSRYAACLLVTHRRNSGAICHQPMPFVCVCATATCRQPAFQVFRRDSWFRPHQYFPPTALLAPTFLASCPISNLRRAGVFSVSPSVRSSVSSLSLSLFLSLSLAFLSPPSSLFPPPSLLNPLSSPADAEVNFHERSECSPGGARSRVRGNPQGYFFIVSGTHWGSVSSSFSFCLVFVLLLSSFFVFGITFSSFWVPFGVTFGRFLHTLGVLG